MGRLEPSWSHLGAILGHLGPSWTLQRPATPLVQVQGEGVEGGVNPSPKGKKGVGRGNALNHLRPKGLVRFVTFPRAADLGPPVLTQGWLHVLRAFLYGPRGRTMFCQLGGSRFNASTTSWPCFCRSRSNRQPHGEFRRRPSRSFPGSCNAGRPPPRGWTQNGAPCCYHCRGRRLAVVRP